MKLIVRITDPLISGHIQLEDIILSVVSSDSRHFRLMEMEVRLLEMSPFLTARLQ